MSGDANAIDRAVEAVKDGRLVVVLDHPERENEGDLVGAAAHATTGTINFMLTHARGAFVGVFVPPRRAHALGLYSPIAAGSDDALQGARFLISVDAADCDTGSSAAERARTVRLLGEPGTRPRDLVRPGHVVPIEARENGLDSRAGHTEAGVALMEMAGIDPPVAVDMEILAPDGEMARGDDLRQFARVHDLVVVTVEEITRARPRIRYA